MRAGDSPSALSGSASAVEVLDLTVEAADGIHVLASGFSLPSGMTAAPDWALRAGKCRLSLICVGQTGSGVGFPRLASAAFVCS